MTTPMKPTAINLRSLLGTVAVGKAVGKPTLINFPPHALEFFRTLHDAASSLSVSLVKSGFNRRRGDSKRIAGVGRCGSGIGFYLHSAVLCITLLLSGATGAWASVLSDLATPLAPGAFTQIPTASNSSYNRHSIQGGIWVADEFSCGTGDFITQYATDAAFDPVNNVIRFMGQAHGNCTGGQFIQYAIATDTWSVLSWPSAFVGQFTGQCGGGPCLQHADEMWNTVDPATGTHYIWYNGRTLKYNPASTTWSAIGSSGSEPHQTATNTLEYFPEMGKTVMCNGIYGCWSINTTTGSFTYIAGGETCYSSCAGIQQIFTAGDNQYNNQMVYVPQKHVLIFLIGPSMWKIDAAGTFTKLANCPVTCSLTDSVPAVDPVSGELVLISQSNPHVWAYNLDSNQWRDTGISYPSMFLQGWQQGNGNMFVGASLSTYGVIWYGKYYPGTAGVTNGTWLYKHTISTPDTTPPSAPSGLTATGVSSSQINLSWTASTDNVGVTSYRVERGSAACTGFTEIATPSGTTFSDTGRTVATSYCYRVRAQDALVNLSGYSSNVVGTTQAADTTAPTTPTNLVLTVISSSQINLAWTVSTDAVGVTGYQVERCAGSGCVNFVLVGSPSTNSLNNGGLSASTLYRYRVRATDAALNLSGYSTIAQATTQAPAAGSDFATRCAAAGVVRCFNFDDNTQLGGTYGDNFGYFNNANTSHSACGQDAATLCPTIDQTVHSSGAGSLKLTIPSGGGAGAAGQWFTNFSADLATQFGANSEFYVQWRQRFDSAYVSKPWPGDRAGGEGPKQAIIGNGDLVGCTPANSNSGGPCRSSNDGLATVVQDNDMHGYAMMYHYIGGSTIRFEGNAGNGALSWQNLRPSPYCTYPQWITSNAAQFPPLGNCFGYFANEWMTFKVRIKPGPLSSGFWINSVVEFWIGREGQATEKVLSVTTSLEANDQYGKIWLLPYISNLAAGNFTFPTSNTWYDDLIISAQDIADPGIGGGTVALVAPTNVAVTTP